jgi:hypothetical protein
VLAGVGQPEAQLTAPVERLLSALGSDLSHVVQTFPETSEPLLEVRPDLGVTADGLLTGHVELKATGKGANPNRFNDVHDRRQWERLRELPNLILTDGVEWALYRTGDRVSEATLPPFAASGGRITRSAAERLDRLITDFLSWTPVVPTSAERLAELLAPLTRIVRDEVVASVHRPGSAIAQLAADWRHVLFPDQTPAEFADAYAQTLTYALLLARLDPSTSSSGVLTTLRASESLERGHGLLAQALRILSEPSARAEIATGVGLLERVIGAVNPSLIAGDPDHDVWLYFYEHFLGAYDPRMREERGVYFTPVEVVRSQVRLVARLLTGPLGKPRAYAEDGVVFLDPAVGTGTYPLAAIDHGLSLVRSLGGAGAVPGRADILANNIHAFELLVGPYTVAHLRVTQRLRDAGATLGADAVQVFLTDTLESPDTEIRGQIPLALRRLGIEHERARAVKTSTPVLVCMGNPPYDRQAFSAQAGGDEDRQQRLGRLLGPFLELARGRTIFSHLASLYNLYVYFWRWAIWKVFESSPGPGIVSFITASSYLSAPGFMGMREVMRRTFDEMWIIDLGGDNRGARPSENVFAIETPVAIAIGVRYGDGRPDVPADVHYHEVVGTREDKLRILDAITKFGDLEPWTSPTPGWRDPLVPATESVFFQWPEVRDIFPWQTPGVKVGRTWPIGVTAEVLERRWEMFASASATQKAALLPNRRFGRTTTTRVGPTIPPAPSLDVTGAATSSSPRASIVRYGYRSLVRHHLLADPRLIDLQRPPLWRVMGPGQVFLVSLLTQPLGTGPAASVTALIPDLHNFRGSFGGKDVIPLWRDAAATDPNLAPGLLRALAEPFGFTPEPTEVFAYAVAILGSNRYTEIFRDPLGTSSPRIPFTRDPVLFRAGVALGQDLIRIETFGDRRGPGQSAGVRPGEARALTAVPAIPSGYPDDFEWIGATQTLRVGAGSFGPVPRPSWEFEFSGLQPLKSWLGYRMRRPAGRTSSSLDGIGPTSWTPQMTDELLELLWTLEQLVDLQAQLGSFVDAVTTSDTIEMGPSLPPDDPLRLGPQLELEGDNPSLWGA